MTANSTASLPGRTIHRIVRRFSIFAVDNPYAGQWTIKLASIGTKGCRFKHYQARRVAMLGAAETDYITSILVVAELGRRGCNRQSLIEAPSTILLGASCVEISFGKPANL